jgi:hypothetical protein
METKSKSRQFIAKRFLNQAIIFTPDRNHTAYVVAASYEELNSKQRRLKEKFFEFFILRLKRNLNQVNFNKNKENYNLTSSLKNKQLYKH